MGHKCTHRTFHFLYKERMHKRLHKRLITLAGLLFAGLLFAALTRSGTVGRRVPKPELNLVENPRRLERNHQRPTSDFKKQETRYLKHWKNRKASEWRTYISWPNTFEWMQMELLWGEWWDWLKISFDCFQGRPSERHIPNVRMDNIKDQPLSNETNTEHPMPKIHQTL